MRHPTLLFFWGLVAALFLWASAAAFVPHPAWPGGPRPMGADALLAGPAAWRPMHMWREGPYILGQTGGAPQIADVERAINDWIAFEGNPRLKTGPVTEKDSNSFQADVVTKDGSLVQRFIIDRGDGKLTPVE